MSLSNQVSRIDPSRVLALALSEKNTVAYVNAWPEGSAQNRARVDASGQTNWREVRKRAVSILVGQAGDAKREVKYEGYPLKMQFAGEALCVLDDTRWGIVGDKEVRWLHVFPDQGTSMHDVLQTQRVDLFASRAGLVAAVSYTQLQVWDLNREAVGYEVEFQDTCSTNRVFVYNHDQVAVLQLDTAKMRDKLVHYDLRQPPTSKREKYLEKKSDHINAALLGDGSSSPKLALRDDEIVKLFDLNSLKEEPSKLPGKPNIWCNKTITVSDGRDRLVYLTQRVDQPWVVGKFPIKHDTVQGVYNIPMQGAMKYTNSLEGYRVTDLNADPVKEVELDLGIRKEELRAAVNAEHVLYTSSTGIHLI